MRTGSSYHHHLAYYSYHHSCGFYLVPHIPSLHHPSSQLHLLPSTGEWIYILVHFLKAFRYGDEEANGTSTESSNSSSSTGFSLADYRLQGFGFYWIWATTVSYVLYLGIGGFLHVSMALFGC